MQEIRQVLNKGFDLVAQAAKDYPPDQSLYVVSSKSGGTAEVLAALEYFWELSGEDGSRFVAVTDPGTPLEKLAKERGFRKVFNADPNVGGRFSALTAFGLVPAALLGLDVKRLLARAAWIYLGQEHEFGATGFLGIPVWLLTSVIFLGFALMAARFTTRALASARVLAAIAREHEGDETTCPVGPAEGSGSELESVADEPEGAIDEDMPR